MKNMKVILVGPFVFLIFTTLMISPVIAHTPEYLTGFQAGLKNVNAPCDVFTKREKAPGTITGWDSVTTPQWVRCWTGYDDGQAKRAVSTPQYKVGYQLVRNDTANDPFDACKQFGPSTNWGPESLCENGYRTEWTSVNGNNDITGGTKNTLPYKTGFAAGAVNKGESICDQFSGKNLVICTSAQTAGFNSNIKQWIKTESWKYGYSQGLKDRGEGDSVGACDIYTGSDNNLCIAGYDLANGK